MFDNVREITDKTLRELCSLCALKNGIFGINGHCVTFPQDITEMCNELPQRKETLLTLVRNIGNKDTDNVFPTSLRVNCLKVINALKWLQKHNIFYRNIKIKENNFDWMNGTEEVNMGPDGVILNMAFQMSYQTHQANTAGLY